MSADFQPLKTFSPELAGHRLDVEVIKWTEQSLLKRLVEGGADFGEVKSLGLEANDLNSETHSLVFRAIERLHGRGEPLDPLTLLIELEGVPRPDGGEWTTYVTNVLPMAASMENIPFHVSKIKAASQSRKLAETAYRLYEAAGKGDTEAVQKWTERVAELQTQPEAGEGCITLAHHVPKPKPWIIEELIPDGFPSMIYGAGGMGKSFLSAYLGIEACRGGQKFIGCTFPEEPLNTLIIDYELDEDVQAGRAQKIARGLNLAGIPENLHYYAPTKPAAKALPEFRGLIKRHDIRFVIIDSWGGSGVDGGNPEDTTAFLTELRNMGIATLILDHQAKSQAGESYDSKTAFGSVYKFNMCRSVFQLSKVGDGKNPMTLCLRHKKSNFSALVDDLIFDLHFQGGQVLFTESQVKTPEAQELELIGEAIVKLGACGAKVNQKALAGHFEGVIGQKRLRYLLEKGDGELWETQPGDRNEKTYKPKTAKRQPYSNCHTAVLENGDNGNGLKPPPEELF